MDRWTILDRSRMRHGRLRHVVENSGGLRLLRVHKAPVRVGPKVAAMENGPVRIAVDATPISSRVTGAARVLLNLLAAFPATASDVQVVALATDEGAKLLQNVDVRRVGLRGGGRWERSGVGVAAAAAGADLLFTVREIAPRQGPPAVVHLFEPPAYRLRLALPRKPLLKDALLHLGLRGTVRRAARVTAGSDSTAAWLRDRYGIEPPVILPGLEPRFRAEPVTERGHYFFHLMTGDPREVGGLVLEGVERADLDGVTLKIAGTPASEREKLRARFSGRNVEVLGWVDDDELISLYRHALAFLHPTRYEGYAGNPVLEAMGLGTPVIVLRAPGVTEAVEGAGIVLDRPDPDLLAQALRRIASDADYGRALAVAGSARVAGLTWEASALRFVDVFRGVLGAEAAVLVE
jgi:glycosyltransferase involved in cell wall biosynthesis